MPKIAVLFNPTAGKGRSARVKSKIESYLKNYAVPYNFSVTNSEAHLRALVLEKSRTHTAIIGCGGDSTVSIIIDEMMKKNVKVPLGMISSGSSNDIALEFGVETLDKACQVLKKGTRKSIDLGAVYDGEKPIRYYIGQSNIGLGSYVAGFVEELSRKKPILGKQQILAGFMGIRNTYKKELHIFALSIKSPKQKINGSFMMAIFNNIKYWATGKILDSSSKPDDGWLNCCLVKPCSKKRLIHLSRLSQQQRLSEAPEIVFLRSKEFDIKSENPFIIQSDGELIGGFETPQQFHEISFRILPSAATFIC